jgi:hypothetical protein
MPDTACFAASRRIAGFARAMPAKAPCWCVKVNIPDELIAQVSAELQNNACLCRACVMKFHRARTSGWPPPKISPDDFDFDRGLMVLTAIFHLRRGYCCDHGCRHCPYQATLAITQ